MNDTEYKHWTAASKAVAPHQCISRLPWLLQLPDEAMRIVVGKEMVSESFQWKLSRRVEVLEGDSIQIFHSSGNETNRMNTNTAYLFIPHTLSLSYRAECRGPSVGDSR